MPEAPLAYLITFRCYGTWLHGDPRGSTHWTPGGAHFSSEPNASVEQLSRERLSGPPVTLTHGQRACVHQAIEETCAAVGWRLHARNARSNHVHAVVSSSERPERVLTSLKAWSTRRLKANALIEAHVRPWSRHGSTVYLWDERAVEDAVAYVLYGQDAKG